MHKAIEREPAHRYPSAALLAEDLRRFLEDRPIAARRIGAGERLARCAAEPLGRGADGGRVRADGRADGRLDALGVTHPAVGATRCVKPIGRKPRHAGPTPRDAEAAARKDVEAAMPRSAPVKPTCAQAVYAARINLVQAAFDAGDVSLGAARLDQTVPRKGEPDLRGFEWNYWRRQTHNERTSVRLPAEKSFYGSWGWELSRDGTRAAGTVEMSRQVGRAVVLDTATLQPLFTEPIPRYRLYSRSHFALNRDGTRVASYATKRHRTDTLHCESGTSPRGGGFSTTTTTA